MAKEKFASLSPTASGVAGAILGFIVGLIGFVWHGMMAQPTFMGMMYRTFSYLHPGWFLVILLTLVVTGFVFGYLFAAFYNWALKKKF